MTLWSFSARLSARLDGELNMNSTLSMNFLLYAIVLGFSFSFLIGNENVMYFSVFTPRHSNWRSRPLAYSLTTK